MSYSENLTSRILIEIKQISLIEENCNFCEAKIVRGSRCLENWLVPDYWRIKPNNIKSFCFRGWGRGSRKIDFIKITILFVMVVSPGSLKDTDRSKSASQTKTHESKRKTVKQPSRKNKKQNLTPERDPKIMFCFRKREILFAFARNV